MSVLGSLVCGSHNGTKVCSLLPLNPLKISYVNCCRCNACLTEDSPEAMEQLLQFAKACQHLWGLDNVVVLR